MKTIKIEIEILGNEETKEDINKYLVETLNNHFLGRNEVISSIKIS